MVEKNVKLVVIEVVMKVADYLNSFGGIDLTREIDISTSIGHCEWDSVYAVLQIDGSDDYDYNKRRLMEVSPKLLARVIELQDYLQSLLDSSETFEHFSDYDRTQELLKKEWI
jgi:hypothetical protein